MYLRDQHAESDIPTLHTFIQENPLGILTTAIASSSYPTIQASHIPWILDVPSETSENEFGVLRGHMARQNPQSKALVESATSSNPGASGAVQLKDEVLVMFNGPVHHYVTPKFYTETKPVTGKVVPTWNYSAVQVYGKATVYFDNSSQTTEYLNKQLNALSDHTETFIMKHTGEDERPAAWRVSDAPDRFVSLLQRAIIGIHIDITRMDGKFKMSQEMGAGDRAGVIHGFQNLGTEKGTEIAQCIQEREKLMKRK